MQNYKTEDLDDIEPRSDTRSRGSRESVAMLVPSVSRSGGGVFTAAAGLGVALSQQAIEVDVFSARDSNTDLDREAWGDVRHHYHPVIGPKSYKFQPALTREVRRHNPNVIHLHGIWSYQSLAALRLSLRFPLLISPHGMLDRWALNNSALKKSLVSFLYERRAIERAACLHALCPAEKDAIREFGYNGPIATIPNGVDLPDRAKEPDRPAWRSDLPVDCKIMLFLGRIHPKKGLAEFLSAMACAPSQDASNWHLVVAGWDQGGTKDRLIARAKELGIANKVHFVGPQFGSEKEACFAHSDAFVLPSFSEGLPMAILEAWSWSLPVLMTEACNIEDGFAYDAATKLDLSSEAMALGLKRFQSFDEDRRSQMGENGARLVKEKFAWDFVAKQMINCYDWMSCGGDKPAFIEI